MSALYKDSPEVVEFMRLFSQLKEWSDDDAAGPGDFAPRNESIKNLCVEVSSAGTLLTRNERQSRELFAAPVDPAFLSAWREYEERYKSVLSWIWLSEFRPWPEPSEPSRVSKADLQWRNADDEASGQTRAIEEVIDFAQDNAGSAESLEVKSSEKTPGQTSEKETPMGKIRWVDDVFEAIRRLGGSATLHSIYKEVENIRRKAGRSVPKTLEATIRRTLEDHSSDSANYRGTDLFANIGRGEWAIRQDRRA